MKLNISISLFPNEIDDYILTVSQLKRNLLFVDNRHELTFTPCLNLNEYFFNWKDSKIPKKYFIDKFNNVNKILYDITVEPMIVENDPIFGNIDFKRQLIRDNKVKFDYFIWLDSDIFFPDESLYYVYNCVSAIKDKYSVLSPEIIRLWDSSWDELVNSNYINVPCSHTNYFSFDPYKIYNNDSTQQEKLMEKINMTKFGAGWFTCISTSLFKDLIDLPESLGSYGVDDTYIMYMIELIKRYKNIDIPQYKITNLIITENNKFRFNPYSDLLCYNKNIKSKEQFRQESEAAMIMEVNNFNKS